MPLSCALCGLFAVYLVIVRIGQTARKHGIADENMLHAVRNPIAQVATR
jgi:hypothetical protein